MRAHGRFYARVIAQTFKVGQRTFRTGKVGKWAEGGECVDAFVAGLLGLTGS